jgi:hypothetical protein
MNEETRQDAGRNGEAEPMGEDGSASTAPAAADQVEAEPLLLPIDVWGPDSSLSSWGGPSGWGTRPERGPDWYASPEREQSQAKFIAAVGAGAMLVVLAVLALVLGITGSVWNSDVVTAVAPLTLAIAAGVCALVAWVVRSKARATFSRRAEDERFESLRRRSAALAQQASDGNDPEELTKLITVNRQQMEGYQALTRGQAKTSYRWSQAALGVGLLALIGGVLVTLSTSGVANKTAVAGLTAIAGALSSYVARTYLRIYERTLQQLNFYFRQPLVTSYILTAERVANKIKQKDRHDDMIAAIIDESLKAAAGPPSSAGDSADAPSLRERVTKKLQGEQTPSDGDER